MTDPDNPVASQLNSLPKYVASTTLSSVDWNNSTLLGGDVVSEVTKLKEREGGELQVHGSSELLQTLIGADLVDEYLLYYFPVHLGTGKKLFRDGAPARALKLLDSRTTSTGVIIAHYEPARSVTARSARRLTERWRTRRPVRSWWHGAATG